MYLTTETIHFQTDDIAGELEKRILAIRDYNKGKGLGKTKIYDTEPAEDLLAFIKKRFNLSIKFDPEVSDAGPAIYMPRLDGNHIFHDKEFKEMADYYAYDLEADSKKLFKLYDKKFFEGEVNLTNATIGGAFTKCDMTMCIPVPDFNHGSILSPRELAAVILHEVGHVFTYFIMMGRFVRSNQVISCISKASKHKDEEVYKTIVYKTAEEYKLSEKERETILKNKDNLTITTSVILDKQMSNDISELGGDTYSSTSCEQLADMFATRCGAGLELAEALNKYYSMGRSLEFWVWNAYSIMLFVYLTVVLLGIPLLLVIWAQRRENEVYDNEFHRFGRVRAQLIEKLKNVRMKPNDVKEAIAKIDRLHELMEGSNKSCLGFLGGLAYFFKRSYRNNYDYEKLQKHLEDMASNDIYVEAMRLSTLEGGKNG